MSAATIPQYARIALDMVTPHSLYAAILGWQSKVYNNDPPQERVCGLCIMNFLFIKGGSMGFPEYNNHQSGEPLYAANLPESEGDFKFPAMLIGLPILLIGSVVLIAYGISGFFA